MPVYPRLRGERLIYWQGGVNFNGLSPASRGTLVFLGRLHTWRRFIPGFAGNACHQFTACNFIAVYPRLRGERTSTINSQIISGGLSPASRGTLRNNPRNERRRRFIPGFAGNAFHHEHHEHSLAVYPRLRGERSSNPKQFGSFNGLSPASRGTHALLPCRLAYSRFIPGFAGNASSSIRSAQIFAVYPRLRGERQDVWVDV